MKRRLLSALLALSMFFSLIPTTFAQQTYDSDGNLTGSPKMIKDLKVEIEAGKLTKFDFTLDGSDNSVNAEDIYFAAILTNSELSGQNDVVDTFIEDAESYDYTGVDLLKNPTNLTDADVTGDDGTGEISALNIWSGPINPAALWQGNSGAGQKVSLSWDSALNKTYDWSIGDTGFASPTYQFMSTGGSYGADYIMHSEQITDVSQLEGIVIRVIIMSDTSEGSFANGAFVADIGALDAAGNLTFPASGGEDTAITAINATITAPAYGNTPDANATNISVTPAAGCTATSATLSWDGNPSSFNYDTDYTASFTLTPESGYKFTTSTAVNITGATNTSVTVDADTGEATVTATFHSAAQQIQTVGAITATVDAPALNTAPANALSGISGTGVATSSVTGFAWSPTDLINGNFKAGQAYTVSFDVSPQSGYKFASGTTTATVNGNTATVNVTSDTSATISYTFAAIDKKVTSISSASGTLKSYKPNDTFALPSDINVVLTYNDGSTAGFSSTNFTSSGFSFVYGPTKSDLTIGQSLAIADNGKDVFVKYTGSDIDGATSITSASIGSLSVTYDPIDSVAVTIDEPAGGKTAPTNAAVVGTVNYTTDPSDVTWYEGTGTSGNQVGSTDKLQYGATYTVAIVVEAGANYKFADPLTSATINSETASSTVDTSDNGTVTLTKTFTIGAAPAVTLQTTDGFDKYNSGNNVVLKTGTNLTNVTASVTVGGTTKTGTYNPADGTITFAAADLLALGANLTSTGETWTASVLYDGITTAKTVNFTAKDTTPYITITDPSDGTISGITHTSGTKVALTKNTEYTLTATPNDSAHWTGTTWTVSGITGTQSGTNNDTYKFTPTGSEDITVSVAFTKAASYTLTVNATNGSVAVSPANNQSVSGNTTTYTIYSDETYTLTATAANQYKFVNWTGDLDASTTATDATITIANPTGNKTVTANFTAKTEPTVSANQTFRQGENQSDVTFTYTKGDYTSLTVSGSPAGTDNGSGTYTVAASGNLETATPGTYTYTFDFGEGKQITRTITVVAARTIDSVTAPTGTFNHGDTFSLTGLSFTVTDGGTTTTYTYNGTSWDNTLPDGTQFSLGDISACGWDAFKAAAEAKITRHDTTHTDTVNNGAQITVSLGSKSKASNALTVGAKAITISAATSTGLDRPYDGTAVAVTSAAAADFSGQLVSGDTVSVTLDGKYYDSDVAVIESVTADETNNKVVKFTVNKSGTDAGNYSITANNGSGKITKRPLTITAINNIPDATQNKADTKSGDSNATISASGTDVTLDTTTSGTYAVVGSDTIAITYHYEYADISAKNDSYTGVTVSNIATTSTNYSVSPTTLSNQSGKVAEREIDSISISDPTTKTYNYSDTFDPTGIKVTVKYKNETPTVEYDWNNVPSTITVKWTGGNAVTASDVLNVNSIKTITASDSNGHSAVTNAITVNQLPVNVEATGTLNKTYDGTTTYTASNGQITYTPTLDSTASSYSAVFAADAITASSTSVAFSGADAHDTAAASNITQANITLSNSNYKINNFTNSVTDTIDKAEVTVNAITNITAIKQYTTGLTGTKTVSTNGSGDVTVTGIKNNETIAITYGYDYETSAVAGPRNNDVKITSCDLADVASYPVNKNYTFNRTYPSTGSGSVTARTISAFTVTAPTQFTNSQSTAVLYGTQLDLTGLAVSISYGTSGADGTDVYTWTSTGWTLTQDGGTTVSVTSVPFTWGWDGGSEPSQRDILTVANNGKGIKATSTDDATKSNTSTAVKVDPITIDDITVNYTGDPITKTYNNNNTVVFPDTYTLTYSSNDILSGDASTVTIKADYVYPNVNYNASAYTLTPTWGLTTANANYKFADSITVTNPLTGTITQRPIKVTGVSGIADINQYDDISTAVSVTSDTNATFGAVDGVTESGLVGTGKPVISYSYQYSKNDPAGTDNAVSVTGITFVSGGDNYQLNNTTLTATGTINAVSASDVRITAPTQFSNTDLQYGDKLNYAGLTVEVDYGATATHTDTFTYDGTDWKKGTDTVTADNLPFTWAWSDSSTHTQNESLAVTTSPLTITATLKNDTSKSATTASSLTVGKRKVNVTPSGTATKMYDGDDTYTGTGITYTVDYVSTPAATITKPTVQSATVKFDKKTVAATQVTVSSPVLSDTTNFVVNSIANGGVVTGATITARPIKLTAITNVPQVNQYATTGISGTGKTATSPTDAVFASTEDTVDGTTTYPIVSGDTVTVKYDYAYTDTATASPTDNVTLSNVALDTAEPNPNYILKDVTNGKATKAPNVRTVSTVDVTNPTQLQTAATYKNQLDLSGMTVKVNYTSGDPDVYTATQSSGTVTWKKDGVTVTPPFTFQWTDTSKGASIAANEVLTVPAHNGNTITVSLTDGSGKTGVSAPVTVNPKEITAITAELPSGEIAKVYDSKTELEAADKALIQYTFTGLDTSDTVTLTTTPSYQSKDVGDAIAIDFTAPSISGNDNYKLKDDVTVSSSLTGKITQKAVTIDAVYVPTTYKNDAATEDYKKAVRASLAGLITTDTVTATGFVGTEGNDLTFDYTIVYPKTSLGTAGDTAVSIEGGAGTVSGTGYDNYSYTWPTNLTGKVLADAFTGVEITPPSSMTGYTHGDVFNPSGMSVTIKTSSNPTGTTHTVTGSSGSYAWNTALPDGVEVKIGNVSLTSNLNHNAHYTNMNGKKITVTAGDQTASTTGTVGVDKANLTVTANASSWDKVYDGDKDVDGVTYQVTGQKTIDGVTDTVTVTSADAKYSDKNVALDGDNNVIAKTITFSNIVLSGDYANYNNPSISNGSGKITPFGLEVTKIKDTISDAYWNSTASDTKTTTNYETAQTAPDTGLTITYKYTYDDTSSVGTVTGGVTISNVDLSPTNTNYTVSYTGGKMNGKVVTQGIDSLAIKTQPTTTYKYGQTLNLSDLEVTVTYSGGGGSVDAKYNDATWTTLGLKIDDASLKHGDALKTANTNDKIKVTTSDGSKYAETDTLTVNQRTLLLERADTTNVTKTYDSTRALGSGQTIELKIAVSQTGYDGLYGSDSFTVNTPTYIYPDENASDTEYTLTPSTAVTISGNNSGEYTLVVPDVKGKITKQSVTLTPVIADIPVNKFATTDKTITETGISIGTKLTQSGIVSGEENNFTFGYTVTVSTTQLGTANTYTITPTATSESGIGTDNYSFTWNDATVKVVANGATRAVFTQKPTLTGYEYGDTVDLSGTKVTVTYADNSTHEFTYGSQEWIDEGLEVQWDDNSAVSTTQILKTSDNKGIQVKVADGVIAGPTNGISVGQRTLTLTATAADATNGIKKTYDTYDIVESSQVSVDSTGKYSTDVVTIGTVTATYDNQNKGTNKTVTVAVANTTIADAAGTDVTNQYNIVQPTNLTGTIEALAITVTPDTIPPVSTGSTGDDLKVDIDPIYSTPILTADVGTVYVTLKGTYDETEAQTAGIGKKVTLVMTENGNSAGNYTFTLGSNPVNTGTVQDNIITNITVDVNPKLATYTHGDPIELDGMKITATYKDRSTNSFTYSKNTATWTAANSVEISGVQKTEITTAELGNLGISIYLRKDNADTPLTSDTQQLRHDTNNGNYVVVKGDTAAPYVTTGTLTVNTKEITTVTPGYTPPTTAAPSKPYDGTTKVPDNSFVYYSDDILPADKSEVEPLLGATAEYAQKDASYEADGTTLKDITINFSNPTLGTNDNYTLASNATMASSNVTGTISKATLTIQITSVPSIVIGGEKVQTLTKGTNYSQSGEQNNETVDVTVKGTYEQNATATSDGGSKKVTYAWSIADTTNNNNYTVSLKNADGDVIDNATVFGPEGTVNKKAVTGIAVTAPTTSTYEHGGSLALEGMTITVKYADDDSDNRTYKFENGKWHETTGGTDTELTGTPEDVTIKWNGTTTDVTDGAKLRLDDSDKGYTVDGDNKKATIKVAPSATGSLVEPATTDITIAKKQLALTVSGNVSKKYDGTNTLSSLDGITATLDGVQGTTPDDVSVDTTKLLNNIRYDGTGTNKAGITTGSPKLVIGTIAITGGAVGYYKAPVVATDATNTVTNNTTGTIEKRPVKVIAITETMDAAIGASNGKLEGIGSISYTLSSDNGLYQLVTGEDVKIDVDYTYGDTSTEGSTTVTYSNPKVSTTDNAYASNYDVSFNIAQGTAVISNGTVTGVTLSGPSQTGSYTHGDKFNLAGTEITITYNNDSTKTDKYSYDTESGKWTLTRNGGTPEATKVELPSELSLKLGSTSINTNPVVNDNTDTRTIVKFTNNTNTLVATYTKDTTTVNSTPSAEYGVEQKKITINITPPTSGPEIEQEYKGKNNKSLDDANLAKLSVEKPTNYAVPDETVSITEGTFKAEFASGSVARDQNGDVIAQAINIDKDSFTLDGADKGNYLLIINNTATGKVTPKAATITANKVPPIKEGAADLVVDITDYTTDGFVEGDTPTITWKGTYNTSDPNAPEIKVDTTTERTLDADTLNNYSVTWSPDSMNGTVTEKVVTEVKVITQPKFSTTEPKHGDKVGENGLDDLEYTVTYSDGSTTKHKKENGEWVTTDGYTEPEAGTTFKWNDTTEDVSKDSVIRKDKENTITITVEGEHDKTSVVTAAAKPVTVKAAGTYTKVYDGTNAVTLNETTPEITYTIEGLVEGDVITVTATPEFADENVAKFGDDYVKAINFTNVTVNGDDDVLANYEIAKTDDVVTVDKTDLKGAITPKEMKITAITVPSKKKGAAVAVSVTNSKAFTTTDIVEKDKDSVTIKYEGAYTSTSAVGENIAVTITDGTLAIDGDDKAMMNYTPKLTGSAAGSVAASSGGGGGGGGAPSNTLTIKDKTEDGKEGEIVKTLTAPAGSTPVDLIGVYKTAPKDPTIIWKSADEKIATVDENGVVSFISEGKTTITATSKTNSSLTAKVEVTVTAPIATPEPTTTPGTVNTPEPTKEPSVITKNMMNPYIVGYDDNVFGPELPISREEVATIFARLIANSIDMDKSYPSQFWDVTENEWSKDYIGYLETFDILHGYDDGSFMPKAYITRAEMAVMMARAEGYDIEGYMDVSELSFPDIPEDYGIWATKAIKYLTDAGVMEGYEDGTFRPTQPITRAETVATVNRVLSDMVVDKIEVLPSDVTDAHWAYDNIVFAMNHRVLKDAAADPNKFVWSEEFDQNIVVKQETVDGDLTDTADGENNSPSESDASAEQTDAPETTASPDAAPEATEMPKEETEPSVSPEPDKEN